MALCECDLLMNGLIEIYLYTTIFSQVEKAKEAIDRVEAAQLEWILRALALSPAAPRATSKGKKCSGEGCTFLAFGAFSSYLITSLNLQKTIKLDQIESWVYVQNICTRQQIPEEDGWPNI